MRHIVRIVALLMAALIMVTSCQAPDSSSQLTDETVNVSFAGPSARTITTDDGLVQTVATSDLWFEYKAEWKGSGEIPTTAKNGWTRLSGRGLAETIKLHRGTWGLSLRAFVNENDIGDDGKFILSGTLPSVEIGANNLVTQTVSINLGYVRQEGNGMLHVSATYPVVYHEATTPGESPVEAVRKVKVTANVSGTDYTGDITAFDSNNVGTLDLTVPAGAAHVTVQYYMDDSSLFEDDQASKDVLIMATMTTNLAVSVDRDITVLTFKAEQPEGTVEDNVIPKVFNSLFDIYPDTISDYAIVVGYAEETKSLGDKTPINYPYSIKTSATPDEQGRYKASELGLVPITVTTRDELNASGATEAWWGKTAALGSSATENTALASIRFVDGVTSIGNYTFSNCAGLTSITIPDGVTAIGEQAFSGCTNLTSITIPDGVTEIGYWAFSSCSGLIRVTIPSSVTTIGEYAFNGCSSLISVTIPNGVTSIGNSAFSRCTGLTSVTISDSVTEIGEFAFSGCTNLTSVTIPNSITSIRSYTFQDCTGLTNITIPSSVTTIGSVAFKGCTSLTSITIPEGVTSIKISTFSGCTSLTSVTIPDSVTEIGEQAFKECSALTSITIPNNVISIGDMAFWQCTGLTSITIPEGVTTIGDYAFQSCRSLTSVTIPNSVTAIENAVFQYCSSLTAIYVNQTESTLLDNAKVPSSCTIRWNSPGPESV